MSTKVIVEKCSICENPMDSFTWGYLHGSIIATPACYIHVDEHMLIDIEGKSLSDVSIFSVTHNVQLCTCCNRIAIPVKDGLCKDCVENVME